MAAEFEDYEDNEGTEDNDLDSTTETGAVPDTFSVEEDDDEGDDDDDPRPSRRERRRNRYSEMKREAEEAKRMAEQALRRSEQYEQLLQERRREQQQAQQQSQDPIESELDKIYREENLLWREIEAGRDSMTTQKAEDLQRQVRELEQRKLDAATRRALRQHAPQQSMSPEQMRIAQLQQENRDVHENPRARGYADGYIQEQRKRGRTPDEAMYHEAVREARRVVLGKGSESARPRGEADRRRYGGSRRGSSGSGSEKSRTFTFDEHSAKMADVMYEHIADPVQRRKLYAQSVGKRLANKK